MDEEIFILEPRVSDLNPMAHSALYSNRDLCLTRNILTSFFSIQTIKFNYLYQILKKLTCMDGCIAIYIGRHDIGLSLQ